MHERGKRVAFERPLLHLEPPIQLTQRLQQPAVEQVCLRVIGVELERPLQAPLGPDPVPVAEVQHRSQRDLGIGARVVHRQRAKGRGSCLAERFGERRGTKLGLRATGQRQACVGGGVRGITFNRRSKRCHGLGYLEHRRGQQMRPASPEQLVHLVSAGWPCRRARFPLTVVAVVCPAFWSLAAIGVLFRDGPDKAVSRSGHGFDVLPVRARPERLPER